MCMSRPRPAPVVAPPPMPVAPPSPPPANATAPAGARAAGRTNTDEMVATRTGAQLAIRRKRGKSGLKISYSGGMNYPGY